MKSINGLSFASAKTCTATLCVNSLVRGIREQVFIYSVADKFVNENRSQYFER